MSKKRNYTRFQDYESSRDDNGYEVGYIRLVDIQLVCMNELSSQAFRLYVMMKSYAKGNVEFEFPYRIFKNFTTKKTFIKSRQELIDKGYLESFNSNANLRIANKYRFSSKWREYNREKISQIFEARRHKSTKLPMV